jgi:hypothetical protein
MYKRRFARPEKRRLAGDRVYQMLVTREQTYLRGSAVEKVIGEGVIKA